MLVSNDMLANGQYSFPQLLNECELRRLMIERRLAFVSMRAQRCDLIVASRDFALFSCDCLVCFSAQAHALIGEKRDRCTKKVPREEQERESDGGDQCGKRDTPEVSLLDLAAIAHSPQQS